VCGQKKSRPKDVSLELSIYSGRLSSMEGVEHKKERLEPLFLLYEQGRHSPSSPIYFPDAAS
jgi:hypothetical protein